MAFGVLAAGAGAAAASDATRRAIRSDLTPLVGSERF